MQAAPRRAPVLAAFCPVACAREPVEVACAVGRVDARPVVVATVLDGAATATSSVWQLALARARRALGDLDVRVLEADTPARGLARALDELRPALIVLGARRGPPRIGTTARRVLHVSSCPVVIVPSNYTCPPAGLRAVGAAFAHGPEARDTVRAAAALARGSGGKLRVISVSDGGNATPAALREAVAVLAPGLDAEPELAAGAPADRLVAVSRRLDLLVMGSRASGPPGAIRLGSVSRAVLERAACPVMLVPRGGRTHPDRMMHSAPPAAIVVSPVPGGADGRGRT